MISIVIRLMIIVVSLGLITESEDEDIKTIGLSLALLALI